MVVIIVRRRPCTAICWLPLPSTFKGIFLLWQQVCRGCCWTQWVVMHKHNTVKSASSLFHLNIFYGGEEKKRFEVWRGEGGIHPGSCNNYCFHLYDFHAELIFVVNTHGVVGSKVSLTLKTNKNRQHYRDYPHNFNTEIELLRCVNGTYRIYAPWCGRLWNTQLLLGILLTTFKGC